MIAIYIDPRLEKYMNEIKYTFSFVFKTLGYELKFISKIEQIMSNDILFYYGLIQPSFKEAYYLAMNKIMFFIPVYGELLTPGKLDKETIKRDSQELRLLKKIPIISKERIQVPMQYYHQKNLYYGNFNFDIIGNVFYNLIGYEEFIKAKKDSKNHILDEEYTFIKYKKLPYVSHLLWLIENSLKEAIMEKSSYFLLKKELWPQAEKFAVVFTHTVNSLRKWNFNKILKSTFEDMLLFYRLKYIFQNTISKWKYMLTNIEDYWNFSKIEEVENQHQINSTYFFGTEKNLDKDVDYRLNDKDVQKEMFDSVHRGDEISLLASHSASKNDVLEKEKDKLYDAVQNENMGVRHYFGKFDSQLTTEFHNRNGFAYDSSISLINNIGFKNGIAFPYHFHKLTKSGRSSKFQYQSKYFELPISFSDNALFISQGKTVEFDQAKEFADEIIREIERINGFLNFDFSVSNMSEISYNKELMNYIAEKIKPKNVFWATCSEIVKWWRKRESVEISESENGVLIYFPEKLGKFTLKLIGSYKIINIEGAKSEINENEIIFSEIKSDTKVQVLLEKISKINEEKKE